ncbi:MAG: hypothetical protein KBD83_06480 [Gammaproteobacteria bacterium]|nr:hypothetical protein [Gammaproteobacteria bacterium]
MHVIIANFGNDSIALIEWVKQQHLQNVFVLSVDTRWSAENWQQRVILADHYISTCTMTHVRLSSEYDFSRLVLERNNFPSIKFHWCASFLKGLPVLDWLDQVDPDLKAIVLLAKRREQAPSLHNLQEFEAESHSYDSRKVWYPLYQHTLTQRNQLIAQAGFDLLHTRSLECDPCIYNQRSDFRRLDNKRMQQVAELETTIGRPMFSVPIKVVVADAFPDADLAGNDKAIYYQGCGSEFGCGD